METGNYNIDDFILNESFQHYVLHKSPSDTDYWEKWISRHPDALAIIQSAKETIEFIADRKIKPERTYVRDQVYNKLQKQINNEKTKGKKAYKSINMRYYWYAASILLVLSFAIILSGNIKKQNSGIYAAQFLEVIVPEGQRSQLILPDGTKVWLNSGSIFKYPVDFLKKNRDVYIEGEAFFNVKHNKAKPFVVHLKEKICISVLGTEFNVKCYANEKAIETTLIKGSIKLIQRNNENSKIREIELKPYEKATFQKNNQSLKISNLVSSAQNKNPRRIENITNNPYLDDITLITAWKENELIFYNETFEEIAIKMERWYGLNITLDNESLKKERFTGKFVNNETIYQVLDIFNRSEPIKYTTKNKEITITKIY